MRKYVRFPSPAMVVAVLALLVATSGASYAAVKVGTKDLKDEAVTSAKVRDRTLLLKDLDPKTVAALKAAGSAKAYAFVVVDGASKVQLVGTRSKGVVSVTRPATGVYCLKLRPGIVVAHSAPVVGVEWDNSMGSNISAFLSAGRVGCPAGTGLAVRTVAFVAAEDAKPSNGVSFTVVVP